MGAKCDDCSLGGGCSACCVWGAVALPQLGSSTVVCSSIELQGPERGSGWVLGLWSLVQWVLCFSSSRDCLSSAIVSPDLNVSSLSMRAVIVILW